MVPLLSIYILVCSKNIANNEKEDFEGRHLSTTLLINRVNIKLRFDSICRVSRDSPQRIFPSPDDNCEECHESGLLPLGEHPPHGRDHHRDHRVGHLGLLHPPVLPAVVGVAHTRPVV